MILYPFEQRLFAPAIAGWENCCDVLDGIAYTPMGKCGASLAVLTQYVEYFLAVVKPGKRKASEQMFRGPNVLSADCVRSIPVDREDEENAEDVIEHHTNVCKKLQGR
jgi:hypothetical protein